ncbi:MAG: ABC transporter substrate-binding protein [bacterium]|nr:ABC transporter substrate-binding protein [bacterium]
MQKIRVALDWTPNINHIGFFVAQEKGWFKNANIDIELINPAGDNYQTTPAKKVELGLADFALSPTESVISYRTKAKPFPMIAVAAIMQKDLSAIVVLEESDIYSPKDLDGKTYASYQARYEDQIVKSMIKNDGGEGSIHVDYPNKLGIWNTLVDGTYDSTWVFMNWEGVEASQKGIKLRAFTLEDYDIPYSYSLVIIADQTNVESNTDLYSTFISQVKAGYLFAGKHPEEAAKILHPHLPEYDQEIDLVKAIEYTAPYYGAEQWGIMDEKVIEVFLNWLREQNLETHTLSASELITNKLLS